MSAPKRALDSDPAEGGGRQRKAPRKADDDDLAPAPAAGRKPRQLRVKLTGASTCTRQLQVGMRAAPKR